LAEHVAQGLDLAEQLELLLLQRPFLAPLATLRDEKEELRLRTGVFVLQLGVALLQILVEVVPEKLPRRLDGIVQHVEGILILLFLIHDALESFGARACWELGSPLLGAEGPHELESLPLRVEFQVLACQHLNIVLNLLEILAVVMQQQERLVLILQLEDSPGHFLKAVR
jgi:hypothetical protein